MFLGIFFIKSFTYKIYVIILLFKKRVSIMKNFEYVKNHLNLMHGFIKTILVLLSFSVIQSVADVKISSSTEDIRLVCPDTPVGKIRANLLIRKYDNYSDGTRRNITEWETKSNNCPRPLDQYIILYIDVKYSTQDNNGIKKEYKTFHPYRIEMIKSKTDKIH